MINKGTLLLFSVVVLGLAQIPRTVHARSYSRGKAHKKPHIIHILADDLGMFEQSERLACLPFTKLVVL